MQTKLQDYMSKKLQVNNTECLIVILLFSLHDLLLTNFSGCLHSCLHTCILSCLHSCILLCLHSCILLCLHSCFHSYLKLFISYYLVSVNFLNFFCLRNNIHTCSSVVIMAKLYFCIITCVVSKSHLCVIVCMIGIRHDDCIFK